jgi:uncharacterized membrane protein YdfJ with MMPL/SSD domain
MLIRLAAIHAHRPRRVALLGLLLLLLFAAVGGPAASVLKAGNAFEDPGSQAAAARRQIEHATGTEPSAGVLALVDAPPASPRVASAAALLRSDRAVASVVVPRPGTTSPLIARDGRRTLVAATLRAGEQTDETVKRIAASFSPRHDVMLGGRTVSGYQVGQQASSDLGFAELLAFPLLALLAFLVFRGAAALLPLAGGVLSVLGAFTVLRAINAALPLSSFALNLVIGLGLGLAVDYSLFMVSRFREELGRGAPTPEALRTTMQTAGRTVIFSALTVAAATAALTVFPLGFLRSMGIGGAVVALVAAAVALTVMPALMVLLGRHIGTQRVRPDGRGGWYRLAQAIMRRPGAVAALAGAVLLIGALPDLRAHWSGVDASVLPSSRSARVVSDAVAADFPQADPNPLEIAVGAPPSAAVDLGRYAAAISRQANVLRVGAPAYLGRDTWRISASTTAPAIGAEAQGAVEAIRVLPSSHPVAVGGEPALFHDQQAAIARGLPLALSLLALSTLAILWFMTGSVILPLKALLMNALTVGSATGLLVLVFQDGRLTGPLAYARPAGIESTDFLVLAALVFALSTDYGVFLLTRIKELRDGGVEDREAVAMGLQRTGGLVTAAALLLAVAIGAFATSQIVFLKEIGLGTAAGVLLDAFIVRTFLVPSLMGLLGRWNWWAPEPLRRLHARLAISEGLRSGSVAGPLASGPAAAA